MTISSLRPLMALVMLAAIGCQAPDTLPDPLINPIDARRLGYNSLWATALDLPASQQLTHAVVLDDLLVCVEAPSNLVTAISMRDGEVLWRRAVGKPGDRLYAPLRKDDQILINDASILYKLNAANGDIAEASDLESLVSTAPALVGDYAVFGGANERVFAHDIVAGYSKWSYQFSGQFVVPPIASDNDVFVADASGVYGLVRANTGEVSWKGRTFGRVSSTPVVSRQNVYIPSEDQTLYAVSRATGQDRWLFRAGYPLLGDLKLIRNTLYVPLPNRELVCLDARTGKLVQRLPGPAQPVIQTPEGVLLNMRNRLRIVRTETGQVQMELPVRPLQTILTGDDGVLILVSPTGRFLRLDPIL